MTVDTKWQQTFRDRMSDFRSRRQTGAGDEAISIKVRVASGCFHREHSPHAYALLEPRLKSLPADIEYVEHESGPELLVYMALASAGLTLAKSVIDLITAILKARSDGVKKGDHPSEPLELIVRRTKDGHEYREEIVLRVGHAEATDAEAIEREVKKTIRKLFEDESGSRKG